MYFSTHFNHISETGSLRSNYGTKMVGITLVRSSHNASCTFTTAALRSTHKTSYAELDHFATVIWSSSRSRIFWSFFDSVLLAKDRGLEGVKLYSRDPGNAHHFWVNFWAPALNLKRHQKCKQNHQKTRGHAHKICLISGPGQITVAFWSMLCMRVQYFSNSSHLKA